MAYDLGNQGCRIKNQRHEINNRLKEIENLKNLLKECRESIEELDLCYLSHSYGNEYKSLLTRINTAINESEEQ